MMTTASAMNPALLRDGSALRAFCYVNDAVSDFFAVLLQGEKGRACNVGNPAAAINVGDLAELLLGLFFDLRLKLNRLGRPVKGYMASPIFICRPNIDRITQLGRHPTPDLREGFARTIRTFMES